MKSHLLLAILLGLIVQIVHTKQAEQNMIHRQKRTYIMSCEPPECQTALGKCANKFGCLGEYQC
jgi:hypothetical protein